jgi:hypothetical protein
MVLLLVINEIMFSYTGSVYISLLLCSRGTYGPLYYYSSWATITLYRVAILLQ